MKRSHFGAHRSALAAITAGFLAATLVGCGRTGGDSSPSSAAIDDKPATGTIEFWAGGAGGGEGEQLPEFLKKFEAANPDVTVNVTPIPSDQFDAKLTAAITAGKVPDMVFLYTQTQASLFSTGGFAAVPAGLVDPGSFFPGAYQDTLVNGVSYAVPWYTYSLVLYYRKDLADAAEIPAPTTWDEFVSFAQAFQDQGVEYPLAQSISWDIYSAQDLIMYAAQNGGSLISADKKSWTINSPENVEALDFWGSLFTDGLASTESPTFLDTVPYLTAGKTVGIITGPWTPTFVDQAAGKGWSAEHLGTVVPPAGPKGSVSIVGGGSFAVLKGAQNPDAAWKLIRWFSDPQVQSDWYDYFGNLPAVESAWDLNTSIQGDPLLVPVREALATGVGNPPAPTWSEVGQIVGNQMERVARGAASAQEALDEAQSRAEEIGTGVK